MWLIILFWSLFFTGFLSIIGYKKAKHYYQNRLEKLPDDEVRVVLIQYIESQRLVCHDVIKRINENSYVVHYQKGREMLKKDITEEIGEQVLTSMNMLPKQTHHINAKMSVHDFEIMMLADCTNRLTNLTGE